LLQWPCNEPLNALHATSTSTRKRNCLHRKTGFFNGLLRKQAKASRIVYISWLNKISSKGQIGSTCMGLLASEMAFAREELYRVQKQLLYLLEFN